MISTENHPSLGSRIATVIMAVGNAGALVSVIILTVMLLANTPVFAQDGTKTQITVDLPQTQKDLDGIAKEVQDALDEIGAETGINININQESGSERPKLGVYLNNMDFEDAYKMRYPYAFGVLVY